MIGFPEFVGRVLFAALCGLIIGIDREMRHKPLGVQAYMLIALGSAAVMAVTLSFALGSTVEDPQISLDPSRLIQGVVGGIGFLGAGAIMTRDDSARLRGVGSGAAIWGAGGIGIACGLGYLKEAFFVAVLIFAILNLTGFLRHRLGSEDDGGDDGAGAGSGRR